MGKVAKVYIASKLSHAERWRKMKSAWLTNDLEIISRWIYQAEQEDTALPVDFKVFWSVDEEDVRAADVVVVYGEAHENLRGALVEAGMGIALGKMVVLAGDFDTFGGSWKNHPNCYCVATLEHVKTLIRNRFR